MCRETINMGTGYLLHLAVKLPKKKLKREKKEKDTVRSRSYCNYAHMWNNKMDREI